MSPKILCALLQYFENAPLIGRGCASLGPVSPIGRIVSQALVGGLHHLYVRVSYWHTRASPSRQAFLTGSSHALLLRALLALDNHPQNIVPCAKVKLGERCTVGVMQFCVGIPVRPGKAASRLLRKPGFFIRHAMKAVCSN